MRKLFKGRGRGRCEMGEERAEVLGRRSTFSEWKPLTQTSREVLKAILLFVALVAAVGCSYVQMQPKGSDRPPAPAVPRLP
jgi:hypothetical protein